MIIPIWSVSVVIRLTDTSMPLKGVKLLSNTVTIHSSSCKLYWLYCSSKIYMYFPFSC